MSSLSSLQALPDSSSVDIAPIINSSGCEGLHECTSHAPSSFQSHSIRSRWYSSHQSDKSGQPFSRSLHKVGPFDVIDKHLGGWGGTDNLLYSGQGFLFIATTHAHEALVPCLADVRGFEIVQQANTRR